MAFPNPGAFTPEARATDNIQAIINQVAPDVPRALNGLQPGPMTAISYREQVVAGQNMVVKVSTPVMGYFLIGITINLNNVPAVVGAAETIPIGVNI